jgi:hypothetical protein
VRLLARLVAAEALHTVDAVCRTPGRRAVALPTPREQPAPPAQPAVQRLPDLPVELG